MAVYPGPISQSLDGISLSLYQAAETSAAQKPASEADTLTALHHIAGSLQYLTQTLQNLGIDTPIHDLTQAHHHLTQEITARS